MVKYIPSTLIIKVTVMYRKCLFNTINRNELKGFVRLQKKRNIRVKTKPRKFFTIAEEKPELKRKKCWFYFSLNLASCDN
jgi:hypothetical protein